MSRVYCHNPISSLEKRSQVTSSCQLRIGANFVVPARLAGPVQHRLHELLYVPLAKSFLPDVLMP